MPPLPRRDRTKPFKEYQMVLKQKPDLPGIHEAIGAAQIKRVKLEDALSEFEAELQIQPRSASAHTSVAQVLILMSRDDEARIHLETALGLDRPPSEIYRMLGEACAESEGLSIGCGVSESLYFATER